MERVLPGETGGKGEGKRVPFPHPPTLSLGASGWGVKAGLAGLGSGVARWGTWSR